jgi:hypothetical protein
MKESADSGLAGTGRDFAREWLELAGGAKVVRLASP